MQWSAQVAQYSRRVHYVLFSDREASSIYQATLDNGGSKTSSLTMSQSVYLFERLSSQIC